MSDAIDLILADHRLVEDLFAQFRATTDATIAGRIADRLSDHDQLETNVLYPFAVAAGISADVLTDSALAHEGVRRQIDTMRQSEGEALVAAVRTLQLLVEEHVAEEEAFLLPALRDNATDDQLEALAARLLAALQRTG